MVHLPGLPYEQKEHAVAYLNSNCGTMSPRTQLMKDWLALGAAGKAKVAVHSYGRCDNNRAMPVGATKHSIFRKCARTAGCMGLHAAAP